VTPALAHSATAARVLLAGSRLARAGGFSVARLVDSDGLLRLQQEAAELEASAVVAGVAPTGDGEARGYADRWLATAVGGPVLDSLLCAPAVLDFLVELTGLAWQPNGRLGTYSYYRQPGHYIGLHRDVRGCELALITCIRDTGGAGGDLIVYPGAAGRRLAEVRADPARGARRLRLEPGDSVVLLGGLVPHLVTPLGQGHVRVVAPLCYHLAPQLG
jgi:hypothetical protein